ncbi:MAG: MFS transporter [Candidatus Binatia bacterium]
MDIGYSGLFAATVFGVMGITSTFGRLVFGFIADLFSKQAAYTANIVTTLIGVAALMLARDPSQPWLLYIYVLFFGLGFGSRAVIFSAVTADIFSGRRFGSIYGYYAISVGAGGALGSWLGGFLHDVTGSYLIPFVVSTLLLALSDLSIRIISFRWLTSYDERLRHRQ